MSVIIWIIVGLLTAEFCVRYSEIPVDRKSAWDFYLLCGVGGWLSFIIVTLVLIYNRLGDWDENN